MWNSVRCSSPFYSSETVVVSYLYFLFLSGKSYSVINLHKAMLLQTLILFGNIWCSDHKLIGRFMKSVFLHKPARPRYVLTWDVSIVLRYLQSLVPLSRLSLKLLTFKALALVALAAAPRAQTLASLHLNNMVIQQQAVVFYFTDILKTSKTGQCYSLKIEHYQEESLCAMHTLLCYIKRTAALRHSNSVFISYVTFNAVSTCTLARWLKNVLSLAGIDTMIYKAHSYRGASASAAYNKGCSIRDILKTADWTSDKNFRKFYCRNLDSGISYTKAVFQK